jgi:hypothetical protein
MHLSFVYEHKALSVFFLVMPQRRTLHFKVPHRWLHPPADLRQVFGLPEVPDRTPLALRSKDLCPVLQALMAFGGPSAEDLDAPCTSQDLYTAKSLCKAQGPVRPQSDRQPGRIPDKLRHLDTEASWSKSGSHGWVYGYGLHWGDNRVGFPKSPQSSGPRPSQNNGRSTSWPMSGRAGRWRP